ncbi:MAG: exodeoxyribonuclease V subunit alpha [Thermodesulfobacteriota bacterium]
MEEGNVRLLDSQFAKFLAGRSSLSGEERSRFRELICRLSAGLGSGDSCLPLSEPERELVTRSGLVGDSACPLRIFDDRLYLQRVAEYERALADRIGELLTLSQPLVADDRLLDLLFGELLAGETDWQRLAAERALEQNFLIITGGPGTGKTTTVVKILALLQRASEKELRIALAAPTGKAAMRLQASVSGSLHQLPVADSLADSIPAQAFTLHRLLGGKRFSPFFQHDAENPLAYDVVVVDEASMVDLALMGKLAAALAPGSRLILLGDENQLASVETGSVLADMVAVLPENRVELQKTYRFEGGIRAFAEAVNRGDSSGGWEILTGESFPTVSLLEEDAAEYGGEIYSHFMEAALRAGTLADYGALFPLLRSFTILCALRNGPAGVHAINGAVEAYLTERGYNCLASVWYLGRPVMITGNDYSLDLYNGDVGVCLPDPMHPDRMKVWFERGDGRLQGIAPGRISGCETAYGITIHKSQGTEVGEVLVVLPDRSTPLVTRELLYTAVTRATKSVKLKSSHAVFDLAVGSRIVRASGLGMRLGKFLKLLG